MKEDREKYYGRFGNDLTKDKMILWQDKYYLAISIFIGFGLPLLYGFYMGSPVGGLAIAGLLRIVFVHHCTFFINSLCHIVGQQTYTDTNTAKDSPLIAVFSYGEGYHNFHHFFQTDYRNGVRFFHFDPTKWTILLLKQCGLVHGLIRTPDETILRARINMEEKRVISRFSKDSLRQQQIKRVKLLIDSCLLQISNVKKELKNQRISNRHELKAKLERYQKELRYDLGLWKKVIRGALSA